MLEVLPITIKLHHDLLNRFAHIKPVSNKLEAQFNFQTLTANWYGDEEQTLNIELSLETPMSFKQVKEELTQLTKSNVVTHAYSDDVFSCFDEGELALHCMIAVTDSELELLTLKPMLLSRYIEVKLHKVLNMIAKQHNLLAI